MIFKNLQEAVQEHAEAAAYLEASIAHTDETKENLATYTSGAYVHVSEREQEPITIEVEETDPTDRHLIILEPHSNATVIMRHRHQGVRNGVIDMRIGSGATLCFIEVHESDGTQTLYKSATMEQDAALDHYVLAVQGDSTERNHLHLTGDGASVRFHQAILATGKRNIRTNVVHSGRNSRSQITTRSVAQDKAYIASHSNVLIEREGRKSQSDLQDHALLVSKHARVENIPGMEVLPDDVQASHAASSSRLNEEHLFYLMSRGFHEADAQRMIVLGFLESVLSGQERIDARALLEQHLKALPDRASPNMTDTTVFTPGMRRDDFPILQQKVNSVPLVYLDNAATAQKPTPVLEAMESYYVRTNANIHRGLHTLSEESTNAYEQSREKIARFIGARADELIFVRNATEGLNLLAQTLGKRLGWGDTILLTKMEHHSNIVPWQQIAKDRGLTLRYVDVTPEGTLDLNSLHRELAQRPKILSLTHVSNVLGTENPIKDIAELAHAQGTLVVVDGAQSVPHKQVDVHALGCDAFVFSGHKMMGPTGIGGVYLQKDLIAKLPPYMGGGGNIKEVRQQGTIYKNGPERYEAGTPNIAGAIGLAAAVDYLEHTGREAIEAHNKMITDYLVHELRQIPQVQLYGPEDRVGSVAFNLGDMHPHDVSSILNDFGVAIRAGHHCAQPLMEAMGADAMCRASIQFYNGTEDVNTFLRALKKAIEVFRL